MFFLGPIGFPRSLRWDNIVHFCFFLCFRQGMDQKPNQTATTSFRQKRFLQEDNRFSRIWNFLQFGDREEIFLRVTQMNTQSVFKFEYTF